MKLLILNAGSSTIKFRVYSVVKNKLQENLRGSCAKIGYPNSYYKISNFEQEHRIDIVIKNHEDAINIIIDNLAKGDCGEKHNLCDFDAIAYRVVHGGEFNDIVEAKSTYKKVFEIAKTYTKAHAKGLIDTVSYLLKRASNVPQFFDFDTLYHKQTMKKENYIYALPYKYYLEDGVRKFGEHGLSHKYIAEHSQALLGKKVVISCHLGSGSSISCIIDGKCVDNSMGLTPLAGVVMSTRCGNIDPSIITYLMKKYSISPENMDNIMNNESGMKGICGIGDMASVIAKMEQGDTQAKLAFDVCINSYVKSIGGKIMQVGDVIKSDLSNLAVIFTAGIGENSSLVRSKIIEKLKYLGAKLDKKINESKIETDTLISSKDSKVAVYVMPTNEELVVAEDVLNYLGKIKKH